MKIAATFLGVMLAWCAGAADATFLDVQSRVNTEALKGGGTVVVGKGEWVTRPFVLKSNVTLQLNEGATLFASTNVWDYAAMTRGSRYFVFAEGATNVAIVGKGVLNGNGWAFRESRRLPGESQPQDLPVMMRFSRCKNLRLEGFTYRDCGAWGLHLRNCDGVTVRNLTCFSHSNRTNDGIDIESSNVLVEGCDFDTGDDAVVFKTESDKSFPVTNVVVRNCRIASRCNGVKFGTGSYCDVRDVTVENCELYRASPHLNYPSRRIFPGVEEDRSGLAGLALEVVDGGRLENVTIRNIDMKGFMVPVFVRFGRRRPPLSEKGTYLRNVLIENVKGVADSRIASSITGVPGLRPSSLTLRNVELLCRGGGTPSDAVRPVPEMETAYPECTMFHLGWPDHLVYSELALPAWGFYLRHADDIRLENVRLSCITPDACEPIVASDVSGLVFAGCVFQSNAPIVPAPRAMTLTGGTWTAPGADVGSWAIAETADPSLGTEAYRLTVAADGVRIAAGGKAGFFYARETLRQLVRREGTACLVPSCTVADSPDFAWRGLMLDPSRHFWTVAETKRFLDRMAELKLNVFHWHLTDNQGWRLRLDRHPEMTEKAASRPYSKNHRHLRDLVPEGTEGTYGPFFYTKDEVRGVIAYAAARQIRVIPEIEIPGHARSVFNAHPELLCFADDPAAKPTNAVDNVYCVGNPQTYAFLTDVLDEVVELFPDEVVHIGGDEVKKINWLHCPKCRAKMRELGVTTPEALQAKVNGVFAKYLAGKGKKAIWWGEIPDGEIPEGLMVMSWLGNACGVAAAKKGVPSVMCPHKSLYFDYTPCLPGDTNVYPWFTEPLPVEKVYAYDPYGDVPADCRPFILGGQACNWTEYTCTEAELDWKVWTRAAAMSEVFWTNPCTRDFRAFRPRLSAYVTRLRARGINAAPLD